MKRLVQTKTFWGAIVAIGYAVFGYLNGSLTIADMGNIIVPAVLALFLRDGIRKVENCEANRGSGTGSQ